VITPDLAARPLGCVAVPAWLIRAPARTGLRSRNTITGALPFSTPSASSAFRSASLEFIACAAGAWLRSTAASSATTMRIVTRYISLAAAVGEHGGCGD
jgi:hypothetical protein